MGFSGSKDMYYSRPEVDYKVQRAKGLIEMAFKEVKPFARIHIPRTAGTTIGHSLGLYNKTFNFHGMNTKQIIGDHPTALELRDYIGDTTFYSITKFAFVRNPWDRRLSEFHDRCRYKRSKMGLDFRYLQAEDFNGWVKYWYKKWKKGTVDTTHYSTTGFPLNAWSFITDRDGDIIVDFIGFFERLQYDFIVVARWLGIGYISMPEGIWYNASKQMITSVGQHDRTYHEFYNKDTIDMVAEMDEKEIDYFGYDFEGVVDENSNSVLARTWRQCNTDSSA